MSNWGEVVVDLVLGVVVLINGVWVGVLNISVVVSGWKGKVAVSVSLGLFITGCVVVVVAGVVKNLDELFILFFSTFKGLPFDKNLVAILIISDSCSLVLLSNIGAPRSPRPRFIKLFLNFSAADINSSPF